MFFLNLTWQLTRWNWPEGWPDVSFVSKEFYGYIYFLFWCVYFGICKYWCVRLLIDLHLYMHILMFFRIYIQYTYIARSIYIYICSYRWRYSRPFVRGFTLWDRFGIIWASLEPWRLLGFSHWWMVSYSRCSMTYLNGWDWTLSGFGH